MLTETTEFVSAGQRVIYHFPHGCPDHAEDAAGQCPGCMREVAKCRRWEREQLATVTHFHRWSGVVDGDRKGGTVYLRYPLKPGESTAAETVAQLHEVKPVALVRIKDA